MKNSSGKPLDDFDTLKMRVFAKELRPDADGFSVYSEDGKPLTGFMPDKGGVIATFTAIGWKSEISNTVPAV